MGFSSYTCAKSNLPVMASTSWGDQPAWCEVVLLHKDGRKQTGSYDGYGRIDGQEVNNLWDLICSGEAKMILKMFYCGEAFEELGLSHNDPGQGHFHDEEFLIKSFAQGGFSSYEEYIKALENRVDSPLFGNIDDLWVMEFQRTKEGAVLATEIVTLIVRDQMILSGGNWVPGVDFLENEQSARLTEFEQEWICYLMNEGGVLHGEREPDEDGIVLKFKVALQKAS
jgi:hypothetical protein